MINAFLMHPSISRHERRIALTREAIARRSGSWGEWERFNLQPGETGGHGWAGEFTIACRNKVFCVLSRDAGRGVTHLMVSSLSGDRPTFHEMQRIKNEIAGEAQTAIEVYPPQSELVDAADAFHIWVLPGPLPFGLK